MIPDGSGAYEHHSGKHFGLLSVPGWEYERYFNEELIPLVDTESRTIADKDHQLNSEIRARYFPMMSNSRFTRVPFSIRQKFVLSWV